MNKIFMDKEVINIIDDNNNINKSIDDNKEVIINYYNSNQEDINIDIIQNNNSYLVINMASFVNINAKININVKVIGDNNKTVINVRSIGIMNMGTYNVCVSVKDGTFNNEVIEDLKGILENGNILFMPILEVDTNQVEASHFATIGGFDENKIFYLENKGLNDITIKYMLKNAFINSLFDKDYLKLINKGSDDFE